MHENMKKKILEYTLIIVTLLSAFASFFTINRAISISEASTWMVPMIWISIFCISLCLSGILIRRKMEVEFLVIAAFLLSLVFAFSFWHFIVLFFCIFLMLSSLSNMRSDLDMNVKIDLWKSLYLGKFKLILALALLISSQYFFTIKNAQGLINIPKLDLSGVTLNILKPILGTVNPGFKAIVQENLTVDQYILKSREDSDPLSVDAAYFSYNDEVLEAEIPANIPKAQKELLKQQAKQQLSEAQLKLSQKNTELVLSEGRQQLSKMAGFQLIGNEKMADIIVSPINKTINDYFQLNIAKNNQSPIFPLILTIVLFFTIWPLGSLLSIIWFGIVILVFTLLVRLNFIKVQKIMVEREMII